MFATDADLVVGSCAVSSRPFAQAIQNNSFCDTPCFHSQGVSYAKLLASKDNYILVTNASLNKETCGGETFQRGLGSHLLFDRPHCRTTYYCELRLRNYTSPRNYAIKCHSIYRTCSTKIALKGLPKTFLVTLGLRIHEASSFRKQGNRERSNRGLDSGDALTRRVGRQPLCHEPSSDACR